MHNDNNPTTEVEHGPDRLDWMLTLDARQSTHLLAYLSGYMGREQFANLATSAFQR